MSQSAVTNNPQQNDQVSRAGLFDRPLSSGTREHRQNLRVVKCGHIYPCPQSLTDDSVCFYSADDRFILSEHLAPVSWETRGFFLVAGRSDSPTPAMSAWRAPQHPLDSSHNAA